MSTEAIYWGWNNHRETPWEGNFQDSIPHRNFATAAQVVLQWREGMYCWWFRNPERTSWYGGISHCLQGFLASFQLVVWDFWTINSPKTGVKCVHRPFIRSTSFNYVHLLWFESFIHFLQFFQILPSWLHFPSFRMFHVFHFHTSASNKLHILVGRLPWMVCILVTSPWIWANCYTS